MPPTVASLPPCASGGVGWGTSSRRSAVRSGAVALVHCRMSALGTVVGGAETVVRALLDTVGLDGTLVAYLGCEDAPPDSLDALDARRT